MNNLPSTITNKKQGFSLRKLLLVLPSILVSLLPQLSCPLCWPAYTALLSSFGLSFVNYTPFLLPAVLILLGISSFSLAFRAKQRHGYKPFIFGVIGIALIILSKFVFKFDFGLYFGIVILVIVSLWNIYPAKKNAKCC